MPDGEKLFPNFVWVIESPTRPADLARRHHDRICKEALRESVTKYHDVKEGFEKHWRRDARQRYNHKPRDPKYQKWKARRFKSTVDLKKTGRTQTRMLSQWQIKAGGNATDKTLSVTLVVSFPFKGGTGSFNRKKPRSAMRQRQAEQNWKWIEQMKIELQRFDEQDPVNLAKWFGEFYWQKVNAFRSGRKRVRIPTRK